MTPTVTCTLPDDWVADWLNTSEGHILALKVNIFGPKKREIPNKNLTVDFDETLVCVRVPFFSTCLKVSIHEVLDVRAGR